MLLVVVVLQLKRSHRAWVVVGCERVSVARLVVSRLWMLPVLPVEGDIVVVVRNHRWLDIRREFSRTGIDVVDEWIRLS